MNVLEIQKLINKIGDIDVKLNEKKTECSLRGENIVNLNNRYFVLIKNEFTEKLNIQLSLKGDVKLLLGFLDDISTHLQNLNINYHSFRIKLTHVTENKQLSSVYKNICQLISIKINVLESIKNDLNPIIKNFDYKLETDFIQNLSETKTRNELQEIELNLKGLPKLNITERFKLVKLLKIDEVFEVLEIDKKAKSKLLALTMGISLDNARHLLSNSYKITSDSQNKSLENYLDKENINI